MSEEIVGSFGEMEKDAIGEIMNITMGSAATAVSNMLSAKVWITTPQVSVVKIGDLSYPELEPSIHVRIEYTLGVTGQNVLVLKQKDVQLILDQLMGLPLEVTDDFEFDEMNISAVCEVMNQMMGASATALSELIETPIDISTPQALVQEKDAENLVNPYGDNPDEDVVQVKFNLTIDGVIESEFISVLSIDLAKEMASKMLAGYNSSMDAPPEPEPAADSSGGGKMMSQDEIAALLAGAGAGGVPPEPDSSSVDAVASAGSGGSSGGALSQDEINALLSGAGSSPEPAPQPVPAAPQQASMQQAAPVQQAPPMQQAAPVQQAPMQQAPPMQQAAPVQQAPMPGYGYQQPYGYPPQMAYGYPPQMQQNTQQAQRPPVNVQAVQLKSFDDYRNASLTDDQNDNLKLLMGVPLNVTVEIGSTIKKVKEILDFSQGTIIELERQAGAPVDVIVNGHLVAKGDVVVIDDNFAVRITEIMKSKFLDNLDKE